MRFDGTFPFLAESINADRDQWCRVGDGFGAPIGGLGNGYSVLGKYGFLRENFNSTPDNYKELYPHHPEHYWKYDNNPSFGADYNFVLHENTKKYILSEIVPEKFKNDAVIPIENIEVKACLPESQYSYKGIPELACELTAFSPLIFGDLEESSVPAQVFNFKIGNRSANDRTIQLQLLHKVVLFEREDQIGIPVDGFGETAFYAQDGQYTEQGPKVQLEIKAGGVCQTRFIIAWHYPNFKTPSQAATELYLRKYATRFHNVLEVVRYARRHADEWLSRIQTQRNNIDFPGAFTRLWFGSLSSLITSSMLGSNDEYFEIESPHSWINTMDVSAYSSWCVLMLYPALEKNDMRQYLNVIHTSGQMKGFVWHSLWNDACHYAEEPTFIVRYCRDFFYFRDYDNACRDWPLLTTIISEKLKSCNGDALIYSDHGNQSYDAWKMPGVGIYVNSAWVYALYGYSLMAKALGKRDEIDNMSAMCLAQRAAKALHQRLWNEQNNCYDCFQSDQPCENHPGSIFLDQLFGCWMLGIIRHSEPVFPETTLKKAADTLYSNNLLVRENHFRGWVNGMLPGAKPDCSNYHANSCWLGPQINLGSLFAIWGDFAKAFDVWASVEWSIHNRHMAVGEWNQACSETHEAILSTAYPSKDTSRFPSYPRYKSCWEELIRLVGVTLDWERIYVSPTKGLDFSLKNWSFGGIKCSISVKKDWSRCYRNGEIVSGTAIVIDRNCHEFQHLEFA